MNNMEVALAHNVRRLLKMVLFPWYSYAHTKAEEERNDIIVRENQQKLERMLEETEKATQLLVAMEKEKEEKLKLEALKQQEIDKKRRIEEGRAVLRAERAAEARLLLSIQREARRKRIEIEMYHLRDRFVVDFNERAQDMIAKTKDRIANYIENPDNKLAMELKFQQLKREFHANPSPETKERERVLSSYKNILFLYIEAKLTLEKRNIQDLVPEFDIGEKGYLTYAEFGRLIRSIGANLTESQVASVIRGVDLDKDGYIDFKEIDQAMQEIVVMGVPGSPWKLYVDPAEDVICYHNFLTNEKFLEYQMNDKVFKTIVIANFYGEADYKTQQQLKEIKKTMWLTRLQNYMIRRIQYMYRYWKAKQWRKKKIWKVEKKQLKLKSIQQKLIIKFLEKVFYGIQARKLFEKQLHLTIEKVYDTESSQIFYYNHHTNISSWERPLLLRRYKDVSAPSPWIPMKPTTADEGELDGKKKKKKQHQPPEEPIPASGYYHVPAKREYPKKPDGLPLCQTCQFQLAIHTCKTCTYSVHYCFACHRKTHAHPMGFAQNIKIKKKQYSNPRKSLNFFSLFPTIS
jgi:hypothetical protein